MQDASYDFTAIADFLTSDSRTCQMWTEWE